MNLRTVPDRVPDALWLADDAEAPIDEWTFDEVKDAGEFDSLRPSWIRIDDLNE
jgi:hypothetical protein